MNKEYLEKFNKFFERTNTTDCTDEQKQCLLQLLFNTALATNSIDVMLNQYFQEENPTK